MKLVANAIQWMKQTFSRRNARLVVIEGAFVPENILKQTRQSRLVPQSHLDKQ